MSISNVLNTYYTPYTYTSRSFIQWRCPLYDENRALGQVQSRFRAYSRRGLSRGLPQSRLCSLRQTPIEPQFPNSEMLAAISPTCFSGRFFALLAYGASSATGRPLITSPSIGLIRRPCLLWATSSHPTTRKPSRNRGSAPRVFYGLPPCRQPLGAVLVLPPRG